MADEKKPNIGRRVILSGTINEREARQLIERVLELEAESATKPVTVIVDTFGGSIDSMYMMVDTLRGLKCPVRTLCMGKAMSAGAFVLACAAKKGSRFMTPNARVFLHQVHGGTYGATSEMEVDVKETKRLQEKMIVDLAEVTGQEEATIRADFRRTLYLTAEEAKEYGIVDEIIAQWTEKSAEGAFAQEMKFMLPCEGDGCDALTCERCVRKAKAKQIVYMVVYEPGIVDTQGDASTPEEIEKMLHFFMEKYQEFNIEHKGTLRKVNLAEGFLAPCDLTIGREKVTKGTAVVALHILDKELWDDIKSGDINGCSIEGMGKRTPTNIEAKPGQRVSL